MYLQLQCLSSSLSAPRSAPGDSPVVTACFFKSTSQHTTCFGSRRRNGPRHTQGQAALPWSREVEGGGGSSAAWRDVRIERAAAVLLGEPPAPTPVTQPPALCGLLFCSTAVTRRAANVLPQPDPCPAAGVCLSMRHLNT